MPQSFWSRAAACPLAAACAAGATLALADRRGLCVLCDAAGPSCFASLAPLDVPDIALLLETIACLVVEATALETSLFVDADAGFATFLSAVRSVAGRALHSPLSCTPKIRTSPSGCPASWPSPGMFPWESPLKSRYCLPALLVATCVLCAGLSREMQ